MLVGAEYMVVLACGAEIGAAVLATLLLKLLGRLTMEAEGVATVGFATAAGVPPIPALIRPELPVPGVPVVPGPGPTVVPVGLV